MFRSWSCYERCPAIKKYDENPSTCGNNNSYQCDMCAAEWQSETEIHIHRSQEHSKELEQMLNANDKNPVCLICLTQQNNIPTLLKHMKTIHLLSGESARRVEREIFVCNECCQVFFNKDMLVIHLSMSHKTKIADQKVLDCPKCFKKIKKKCLWAHFQFHQVQSVACCPICLTKCKDRKDLQEHVKTHPSYYNCQTCAYETKNVENFYKHLDKHGQLNEGMSYGDVEAPLQKYFIPKVSYMRSRYQKLGSFDGLRLPENVRICVVCREICSNVKQMTDHIKNHNNTIVKVREDRIMHTCSCGEAFFNKVLLKHHLFKEKGDLKGDLNTRKHFEYSL